MLPIYIFFTLPSKNVNKYKSFNKILIGTLEVLEVLEKCRGKFRKHLVGTSENLE